MSLRTPYQTDNGQYNEHRYKTQPERLLQHTFRQRFIGYVQHTLLTAMTFPPGITSEIEDTKMISKSDWESWNSSPLWELLTCKRIHHFSLYKYRVPHRDSQSKASVSVHRLCPYNQFDSDTIRVNRLEWMSAGLANKIELYHGVRTLKLLVVSSQVPKTHGSNSHISRPQNLQIARRQMKIEKYMI